MSYFTLSLEIVTQTCVRDEELDGWTMVKDDSTACDFCKRGHVVMSSEEMAFRQWSDKGYIHCRVQILIGTCDQCGSKTLTPNSQQIFDAAFRREYDKLR